MRPVLLPLLRLSRLRPGAGLQPALPSGLLGSVERGMVTAEFAVVLPAVVLVLALAVGALGLAWDQIRCVDAAGAGARAAARGDSAAAVTLVARRAAPAGAVLSVNLADDLVSVSVVSGARVAGGLLPPWLSASSTAWAARESSGQEP